VEFNLTTIGFIRHGITDWNHLGKAQGITDIPLNEVGKQQAFALGIRLSSEEKWDILIASNLTRAIETAQIIGREMNLPMSHTEQRIREINLGKVEGTTEEDRLEKWGHNWRELDLDREQFEDVSKRGIEFLEDLAQTQKGKRILVVSHGALIGLTLQRLLPNQFQKTVIDNASLTILTYDESQWECPLYNCTKHLSG
jgi:2,3-bisphosphoglycerate-dependent phosphoglycerate mutase